MMDPFSSYNIQRSEHISSEISPTPNSKIDRESNSRSRQTDRQFPFTEILSRFKTGRRQTTDFTEHKTNGQ